MFRVLGLMLFPKELLLFPKERSHLTVIEMFCFAGCNVFYSPLAWCCLVGTIAFWTTHANRYAQLPYCAATNGMVRVRYEGQDLPGQVARLMLSETEYLPFPSILYNQFSSRNKPPLYVGFSIFSQLPGSSDRNWIHRTNRRIMRCPASERAFEWFHSRSLMCCGGSISGWGSFTFLSWLVTTVYRHL